MLSKTAVHALRAISALAERPEEYQGAARLAERVGAPANYLGKLLQTLAAAGLVTSQKGLGGGFRLRGRPDAITVFDVVEPIDRVSRWTGCFMGNSRCTPGNPCPMHGRWARMRASYLKMLKESTLAEVASGRRSYF